MLLKLLGHPVQIYRIMPARNETTDPSVKRNPLQPPPLAQFSHRSGRTVESSDGTEIVLLNENHDERPSEMRPLTNEEEDLPLIHEISA